METLTPIFWIAQAFGLVAFVAYVWSFQLRRKVDYLNLSVVAEIAAVIQYLLLGGFAGAATKTVAIARSVLVVEKDRHHWKSLAPLIFLVVAYIIILCFSIGSWQSALVSIAILIHTIVIWFGNPQQIRLCTAVVTIAWVIYDASVGSIFGLCTDAAAISSALIGLYRYRKNAKNTKLTKPTKSGKSAKPTKKPKKL